MRSLVRDLGELLGCGAHVAELRRLWVDPFREPRMWTLEALQALAERGERSLDACLLPIEAGMTAWPAVAVDRRPGAAPRPGPGLNGDSSPTGSVALFDERGRALGLGEVDDERLPAPAAPVHMGVRAARPDRAVPIAL